MSASLVYLTGFSRLPTLIIWAVALIMLTVASYLLTRPSRLKVEQQRAE
jgi:hypothetical protein